MSSIPDLSRLFGKSLDRRSMLKYGAGAAAGVAAASRLGPALAQDGSSSETGAEDWNPESIRELAGTLEVDTAAELHAVVPEDYDGEVSYWNIGPNQSSPPIDHEIYASFQESFNEYWPNLTVNNTNQDYNEMLDQARVTAEGRSSPGVVKFPILWGVEFAARGWLQEVQLEDFGYTDADFWPGALKSVMWEGKLYGIPTNNETMAFIYNKDIFARAGLDPESPPDTWDDVVAYSKQITDELGPRVRGYGMVARPNAGNTPFRFMPTLWSYGASALDEGDEFPEYRSTSINSEEGVAALQTFYDMYVRDRSVPTSALTNTQVENQDLFIQGQVSMMISHPSEYVTLSSRVAEMPDGEEKERAQQAVDNMAYTLIPRGPARRAVVFGGSNIHMLNDEAHGGPVDVMAARAVMATATTPEWSVKNAWTGSNPGHIRGFETQWMAERLEQIRFLDVTTSMLPYGIPFPVVPESTEIMNIIIPDMLQNALTQTMTVQEAADDAAAKIQNLIDTRIS